MRGVETNLAELAENRVRLTVEVASADIKHAVEHAGTDLAERTKVPGFRAGKVPMPILVRKLGKERIYTEAVETHVGAILHKLGTTRRAEAARRYRLPD